MLLQLLLHSVDVCARQVDFVDCNHDFDTGCGFGVIDCLDRLRHYAVVGRND